LEKPPARYYQRWYSLIRLTIEQTNCWRKSRPHGLEQDYLFRTGLRLRFPEDAGDGTHKKREARTGSPPLSHPPISLPPEKNPFKKGLDMDSLKAKGLLVLPYGTLSVSVKNSNLPSSLNWDQRVDPPVKRSWKDLKGIYQLSGSIPGGKIRTGCIGGIMEQNQHDSCQQLRF